MSAILSPCRRYRYSLLRKLEPSMFRDGRVLFVMLNPSTADEDTDDPTIRKCRGFAERWGFAEIEVVNLYAWRATRPADLRLAEDPVGYRNDDRIRLGIQGAHEIVVAWGRHGTGERADRVIDLARTYHRELRCLGVNADGSPKHPLYVPYAADLRPWPEARA